MKQYAQTATGWIWIDIPGSTEYETAKTIDEKIDMIAKRMGIS
jgi:hypothetical protein